MTYKATNGQHDIFKNFDTLADAEVYFIPILGDNYIIAEAPAEEQIIPRTAQQKVADDLAFGNSLYFEFLVDNEATPATAEEVGLMFLKFGRAKNALLAGAIVQVRYEVSVLTVDSLFTQERKDKYLLMIDNYLSLYE